MSAKWLAVTMILAVPRTVFAQDGELPPELALEPDRWRLRGGGVHPYVEGGLGAVYAPDLHVAYKVEHPGGVQYFVEPFMGPAGYVRGGINVGLGPAADVQLGVGSFLGGTVHWLGDVVFAYPHAIAQIAFGPGEIYRARVGLVLGALVPTEADRLGDSPAYFGFHGEISPLALRFGPEQAMELSITQGLGLFGRSPRPAPSSSMTNASRATSMTRGISRSPDTRRSASAACSNR